MGRFLVNTRELGDSADVLSTLSARLGSIRTDLANGWSAVSLNTADDPKVRTMDPEGRFEIVSRRLVDADEALQGTTSTLRMTAENVTAADRLGHMGASVTARTRARTVVTEPTTGRVPLAASVSAVLRQSRTAFAGGPNPSLKYMVGAEEDSDDDRSFGDSLLHYAGEGLGALWSPFKKGGGYLKKKLSEVDVFKTSGSWFMDEMKQVFSGDWKNPTTVFKAIGWVCVGVGVAIALAAASPAIGISAAGAATALGLVWVGSLTLAAVHVGVPWFKGQKQKLDAAVAATKLESPDQEKTAQAMGVLLNAAESKILWEEGILLDPRFSGAMSRVGEARELLESDCLQVLARQQFYEAGIIDEPPGSDELRLALAARSRLEELINELEDGMSGLQDWFDIAQATAPKLTGLVYLDEGDALPAPLRLKAELDLVDVRDMLKLVPGLQIKNEGSGSVDRFHQHIADEFLVRGVLVFLGESVVSEAWDVNQVVWAIENGERVTVKDYEHALSFRDQLIGRLDSTKLADLWQGEVGKDERIADIAALAAPDCPLVATETQLAETKELVKLEQEAMQLLESGDPQWQSDLKAIQEFREYEVDDYDGWLRKDYEESGTNKGFLDWLEAEEETDPGYLESVADEDITVEWVRGVREARDRLCSVTESQRWSELAAATEAGSGHTGELAREGYEWVVDDVSEQNDPSYWADSGSGEWHDQVAKEEKAAAAREEAQEKIQEQYEQEIGAFEKATGMKATDVVADSQRDYLP